MSNPIKKKRGRVLNMRTASQTEVDAAVKIDRTTNWGNPFKIGYKGRDRADVIARYKNWMRCQVEVGDIGMWELAELHGRDLACWGTPEACHGDTLIDVAEWAYNAYWELLRVTTDARRLKGVPR